MPASVGLESAFFGVIIVVSDGLSMFAACFRDCLLKIIGGAGPEPGVGSTLPIKLVFPISAFKAVTSILGASYCGHTFCSGGFITATICSKTVDEGSTELTIYYYALSEKVSAGMLEELSYYSNSCIVGGST